MSTALERRFLAFLSTIPGAESLDRLMSSVEFDGERRADFLLFDRRVILEVKSLQTDTSPKVDAEMERYRYRDDFPLIYGEVELHKVLKHLPDGKQINERIFFRITRSVEDATRSAEDQIENTSRLLNLPESAGVFVLLNESVEVLTPDIIASRVAMLMRRKKKDGTDRSPIAYCWLLFEGHTVTTGPAEMTLPMISLEGPRAAQFNWFGELLARLQVAWARYNGRPLFHVEASSLDKLAVAPVSAPKDPKPGDKISRQQLWEFRYRQHPYLRPLSDSEVLRHGRTTIDRLTPYFLVGAPKASSGEIDRLMAAWSDFLCEARHRGLDLRHIREA